jgi:hypothetical protein
MAALSAIAHRNETALFMFRFHCGICVVRATPHFYESRCRISAGVTISAIGSAGDGLKAA